MNDQLYNYWSPTEIKTRKADNRFYSTICNLKSQLPGINYTSNGTRKSSITIKEILAT